MTWFAAHVIIYVKYKNTEQDDYPAWENIYLIKSNSVDEAYEKAKNRGMEQEGDSDGTFMWDDKSAELVFGGIRKLIECQNSPDQLIAKPFDDNKPEDGAEISYSQFLVKNKNELNKLIDGEPAEIVYTE